MTPILQAEQRWECPSLPPRLAAKIEPEPMSGCWLWTGALNSAGYGQTNIERRRFYVHRLLYELFVAVIPPGLEVDHLCRNRACCNPMHLEAVTSRENKRRAGALGDHHNGEKTYCKHGHEFTFENTYVYPNRRLPGAMCRGCITCKRAHNREWMKGYQRG